MPRSASRTHAALVCATIVLVSQVVRCSATSTVGGTGVVFVSKPACCYMCDGCYDKDNQQRYTDLISRLAITASWRQAMCKSKANTCTTLSGPTALATNKNLVLQPYQQLLFSTAGARRYANATLTLTRATALQSLYTALTLLDSTLTLASPHAWLSADNGTLTLDRSTARGTLRLLHAAFLSLDLVSSTLALSDTPTSISYTRWTLLNATAELTWTAPATAPPPAPPAYLNSFPAVVTNSYVNLTDSVLRFVNVQDAYISFSTVRALRSRIVLVNSNLRMFDCKLDLVSSASIELTNSTLLLGKVALRSEVVVKRAQGALKGLPAVMRKSLNGRAFAIKGSGKLVLGAK